MAVAPRLYQYQVPSSFVLCYPQAGLCPKAASQHGSPMPQLFQVSHPDATMSGGSRGAVFQVCCGSITMYMRLSKIGTLPTTKKEVAIMGNKRASLNVVKFRLTKGDCCKAAHMVNDLGVRPRAFGALTKNSE